MGCKFYSGVDFFNLDDFVTLFNASLFQYWMKNRDKKMPVVEPIREEDWMWFRFVQTLIIFWRECTFHIIQGGYGGASEGT